MSGRVCDKYSSFPTIFWYESLSKVGSSLLIVNLLLTSIGVSFGRQSKCFVSFRSSSIYFYWVMRMPSLDLENSIPKKYFNNPNCFTQELLCR